MWTYLGKQITIAINLEQIQRIHFDDGTEEKGFNAIKPFNRGIFVNPTLDKKKYLSLLKVFHPDVSDLNTDLATQIARAIISAKDGISRTSSPWKTNHQSQSQTKAQSPNSASSDHNYSSWWQQYNWAGSTSSNKQKSQSRSQDREQKPPEVELDFETLLSCVPTQYWKIFGVADTFERDTRVNFRIFKRCYYGYFDTELEIVFRSGCIYREKIIAIHRNIVHVLDQISLDQLTKSDLWTICEYQAIPYTKFQRKDELVEHLKNYLRNLSLNLKSESASHYWTVILTSPKPLWKHKFVDSDYHGLFEQFDHTSRANKQQQQSSNRQAKTETAHYFNCGQYLKFKNQWLERDEFLYFLSLTRKLAKRLNIETTIEEGYPAYPIHVLDLAWQKLSL